MAALSLNYIARAIWEGSRGKSGAELESFMKNAVKVLSRKKLLGRYPVILSKIQELSDKERGLVRAKVSSARPLGDDEKSRIASLVGKRYGGKLAALQEEVRVDLLGGVKIEVGDEVVDLTFRNKIKNLAKHLAKTQ